MDTPSLPGLVPVLMPEGEKRRGRPKGSKNKRSSDLLAWVTAEYGGLTPGQQSAAISLVTAKEVRLARPLARELGVSPVLAAMMIKAEKIAKHMGWHTKDAWAAMTKEREILLPYVHQRQPQAPDAPKGDGDRPVLLVADVEAESIDARDLGGDGPAEDDLQGFQQLIGPAAGEVSQPKSHALRQPADFAEE
jgi:hypothetical protein